MVKSEDVRIGLKLRMIENHTMQGTVYKLGVLGQKNWFKIHLTNGRLYLVQKPELWETFSP